MQWEKCGFIYKPDGTQWWARKYTHLPTADVLDEVIRVYFAGLDENNYGRIGYVDLDKANPARVVHIADEPVLDLGALGTFDDCGAVPSHIVTHDGKKYLYYVGFQRAQRVPYMLFTGLATAESNSDAFSRYSRTPILDRTPDEPFSRSAPFILIEDGIWKMWYWSCLEWTASAEGVHYNNVIRYATSLDGIQWRTHEHLCITPQQPDEYSIGRPSVIRDGDLYHMWYSVRAQSRPYIIGYAVSEDGIHWTRQDEDAGITTSAAGWDSEMVCYPQVVDVDGQWHMFYNGNRHGMTGFGYAVLKSK